MSNYLIFRLLFKNIFKLLYSFFIVQSTYTLIISYYLSYIISDSDNYNIQLYNLTLVGSIINKLNYNCMIKLYKMALYC